MPTLQDVENALGQLFNQFQTCHDFVQDNFVEPLNAFPSLQVDDLDFTHDQCVQQVQTAMGKLYGPNTDFSGGASETIATLIGNYFDQESKVSSYSSYSLSSSRSCPMNFSAGTPGVDTYIDQLSRLCLTTASDMQPHLDAINHITGPNIIVSDVWDTLQGIWQNIQSIWNPPPVYAAGPGQTQTYAPQQSQTQLPSTGTDEFWGDVSDFLDFLGEVMIVIQAIIECVKQLYIDVNVGELGWSQWQWINQMGNLKDQITQQNRNSQLPGSVQNTIDKSVNLDVVQLSQSEIKTVMKGIQKNGFSSYAAQCGYDPKTEQQNNYGAGYIMAYDSNGKLIQQQTPYFYSPPIDPKRAKGRHVEKQIVDWTVEWLNAYNKAHPNAPIKSMVLNIFTYKAPCGPSSQNCAGNLSQSDGNKSVWEQEIYNKTNPHVDVTISVWTTGGVNSSKVVTPWPK